MKAHEALIAWSGWDDESPMRGKVAVGRIVGEGQISWTDGYSNTGGAALEARRKMRGAQSLIGVVKDFHYLVVDERLDPEAVHKAFLAIDEYAKLFG
ncbi:hypothetical protein P9272_16550 [Mesorhizobium sp. WSM4976]|uniref:hypothetical protein n=1 Tax=Mesorhizobium sp. WSM4976 TaxID=3038549 RepID=UPI002416CB77|nr:hypothetical protein [Mesorhizobium sp. WSM4976]MDG4895180.1 hypothetical protein [Mesorhizobium sp. WSM4976]